MCGWVQRIAAAPPQPPVSSPGTPNPHTPRTHPPHTQVTKPILAATAAIVGGCILLVSFGSHSSRSYNMGELLGLYNEPAYVAYLVVGAAVVVASYGVYWKGRRAVR